MKNILVILVGGTICCSQNHRGSLSVSEKAGALLKENFLASHSPFADKVNIDLTENLFILSENMTVEYWQKMLDAYVRHTKEKAYDGVIFAHGTDTLGFSAPLFSLILSGSPVPVFFVSANKPLHHKNSNGNANFACAVECICQGIKSGVYVAYKNISDGKMYLHLASRITQCKNYSDDFVSQGMLEVISTAQACEKMNATYPTEKRTAFIDPYNMRPLKSCVLYLEPYVGIDYSAYDYSRFSAVLHGTYHSGTACALEGGSVLYMIDRCSQMGVEVYLAPARLRGEVYETADIIGHHTAPTGQKPHFLYGYTREMTYCKLLLAYSLFEDAKLRERFLNTECNFEIIGE